ncbi:MAG: zinc ribbon domain-containing protein [Candidatus Poseidoniaceae archaeon]|nr:zinc ribbon domain-containing protein [Candidatus Poseidoniaceae archaeon]
MARQMTSVILLLTPILVLNALRFLVTPLGEMMSVSPMLDMSLHVVSLGIGIVLFRKTRIVRDHEWQRSRAVKSVGGHFKAEEKGVWEKDIHMDTQLSDEAEANLKGQVGGVMGGVSTAEDNEIDSEVEVEMLIDSEHVRRAQARVSGDEQFEGGSANSTIGAVRKNSPMDNFLDWISSLLGRDGKAERDAKKSATLNARSSISPVIAQRPIAPIQPIESEEKKIVPMEMVSLTDAGAESITIDDETNQVSAPIMRELSIEQMAFGTAVPTGVTTASQSGFSPQPSCKVCGFSNPVGERFCSNCGSDI